MASDGAEALEILRAGQRYSIVHREKQEEGRTMLEGYEQENLKVVIKNGVVHKNTL